MGSINAAEFKTKCLAILDEVAATGRSLVVLKRGVPVVEVIPAVRKRTAQYPQYDLLGSVTLVGDVTAEAVPPESWNAESA